MTLDELNEISRQAEVCLQDAEAAKDAQESLCSFLDAGLGSNLVQDLSDFAEVLLSPEARTGMKKVIKEFTPELMKIANARQAEQEREYRNQHRILTEKIDSFLNNKGEA